MRFQGAIFEVDGVLVATPFERTAQIEAGRIITYDDALRLVLKFKAAGLKLGVVASAKNDELLLQHVSIGAFAAREREINAVGGDMDGSIESGMDIETIDDSPVEMLHIPEETTLLDVFDANISEGGVLAVAKQLGFAPNTCIVITNRPAQSETAASAPFYIGVARDSDTAALQAKGADMAVSSLDDVDVERLLA